ncbi:MAG: penicillin-binding protein activator [Nitrososphaerota archaeon]|nr:penicillin-binding protein activator [Candidatus Calditenuaceae archaeon]MDW8073208.1 penicillin-binding protein activator [Nitrososphaerota archaeon]
MNRSKTYAVSTVAAVGLLVVGLIVGGVIGIFAAPTLSPPSTLTTTVVQQRTVVLTTTVRQELQQPQPVKPLPPLLEQAVVKLGDGLPYIPASLVDKKVTLTGEIRIGALLSLSGDLRTFGENHKASLELARDDINNWLSKVNPNLRVVLEIEDTATQPEQALAKLQALAARGIKMVAGPLSSREIRNLKTYADENNILVVSQSSTAVDLAVPGDNVFRLIADDRKQGPALARLMWDAGIKFYVPMWRGDTYGDGLKSATESAFKRLGGAVDSGIRYNPDAKEFATEVATLESKVRDAIAKHGKEAVAVHLISFEEGVLILQEAAKRDVLRSVRWFGSDGTAGSGDIQNDPAAAQFNVDTKFLHTIFAATTSDIFDRVRNHVRQVYGREPETYTYTMYDILWIIVLSIITADKYDTTAVKAVLPSVSSQYFGASGWAILNESGDRVGGDYDVWAIEKVGDKLEWRVVGTYRASTDSVEWAAEYRGKYT